MGTDSVIFFRTDGNTEIATGHIMRCLSIARACFSVASKVSFLEKISVCFLVSDDESSAMVHSFLEPGEDITVQILENADYQNLEQELPVLTALLASSISSNCKSKVSSCKPVFFLDSYFITPKYLKALAPYAYIAYLDDLQLFDYPVDLVINYDVLTPETQAEYKKKYSSAKKCLLGAAYTPLREQFTQASSVSQLQMHKLSSSNSEETCNILITSGGSDPYHTCLHFIGFFMNCYDKLLATCPVQQLSFHVVVGKLNSDKEILKSLAKNSPFLTLHENVTDMASLMSSCDLAFSAAGTTLYELCALGIPTASFVLANNQLASAKAFEESGAVHLLGDVRIDEEKIFVSAKEFIEDLLTSPDKYKKTATRMQQLVDGQGAIRIAEYFIT